MQNPVLVFPLPLCCDVVLVLRLESGNFAGEVVRALKRDPRDVEINVSLDVENLERAPEYAMSDGVAGSKKVTAQMRTVIRKSWRMKAAFMLTFHQGFQRHLKGEFPS
jgi:hypothetical protein